MDFNVILFDDFEVLDVFGPVEVMGKLPKHYDIKYYSQMGVWLQVSKIPA